MDAVDLESMRLLVAIDDRGSISAAARALGVSQPAATSRLRAVEARYRITLVRRSTQGSRLTEDGQAVCAWARSVLREAAVLESGLAALSTRRRGDLTVAASLTVAEQLMPGWLATMHEGYPDVQVALSVVNSADVLAAVTQGRVGVGFVETPGRLPDVQSTTVGHDRLLVVVAPGHRWTRARRPIGRAALLDEAFVLREAGSGTRVTFTRALGAEPRVALAASSTGAVIASAMSGLGPAVVSGLAVQEQIAAGRLAAVPTDIDLVRPLRAVWERGARLRPPASDLVAIARASQTEQAGQNGLTGQAGPTAPRRP